MRQYLVDISEVGVAIPVSINDRYFKGNYEFRGYDNAGIGPRVVQYDANTGAIVRRLNSLGGNAFGIASAEVSFPVGIPNLLEVFLLRQVRLVYLMQMKHLIQVLTLLQAIN